MYRPIVAGCRLPGPLNTEYYTVNSKHSASKSTKRVTMSRPWRFNALRVTNKIIAGQKIDFKQRTLFCCNLPLCFLHSSSEHGRISFKVKSSDIFADCWLTYIILIYCYYPAGQPNWDNWSTLLVLVISNTIVTR